MACCRARRPGYPVLRPQLSAYQLLYELVPTPQEPLVAGTVSIGDA